jgi:hypothetical protein
VCWMAGWLAAALGAGPSDIQGRKKLQQLSTLRRGKL